jgi:hypothetical protein
MHKVDETGATVGGEFQDGDVGLGVPATLLGAKWHNAVQRELLAVTEAGGLPPDDGDDAQLLEAIRRLTQRPINLLWNGDLRLWQRGSNATIVDGAPKYTADHWWVSCTGAGNVTVSRQVLDGDVAGLPPDPDSSITLTRNGVVNPALASLRTYLEDLRRFQACDVTLSFYAKGGGGNIPGLTVKVLQIGGVTTEVHSSNHVLTTDWQRIELPIALPPVSSGANFRLEIRLEFSGLPVWAAQLTCFQLQYGAVATEWSNWPAHLSTPVARRYFQKSYHLQTAPGTATSVGLRRRGDTGPDLWNLAEALFPMRDDLLTPGLAPTVRWYAPDGTPDAVRVGGVNAAVTGTTGASGTTTGYPTIGSSPAYGLIEGHWTADAELAL